MTPLAKRQLCQALHHHYRVASRREKGQLLTAFVKATGYHRKYAIELLAHAPRSTSRQGPTWVRYNNPVVTALRRVWEASGYLCSKRLHPFLSPFLEALERAGEVRLSPPVKASLLEMSAATIDRKLAPHRRRLKPHHGLPTTFPGSVQRQHVPHRIERASKERRPGFTEMDLVGHCGESVHGEYVQTLSLVDLASGWYEPFAILTRGQQAVFGALTALRGRLPFPLRGIHSDNDVVFINAHLIRYCQTEHLTFTRSRSYMKNDQAHVEERNGAVIRRLIGYDRYEGQAAAAAFNRVYEVLRLWINFFQPSLKLQSKQRRGAKIIKRYEPAKTPYHRVIEAPEISRPAKASLRGLYETLNPIAIRRELEHRIEELWTLAIRSELR